MWALNAQAEHRRRLDLDAQSLRKTSDEEFNDDLFGHSGSWCFGSRPDLSASADAQELLSVRPLSISVQAAEGVTPPSQSVEIVNDGNHSMKWSIEPPTAAWLIVSPTSGVSKVASA